MNDTEATQLADCELDGWARVHTETLYRTRWSYVERSVYKNGDSLYFVDEDHAATEYQEGEGVINHGPCVAKQETVTVYVPC